jgi:hypothetical protein
LKKALNEKVFEDGESNAQLLRKIELEWSKKAFIHFNKIEIKGLLTSLSPLSYQASNQNKNARILAGSCECNGGSFFDCDTCNGASCRGSGSGCGFLWAYSCVKTCAIPPQPGQQ